MLNSVAEETLSIYHGEVRPSRRWVLIVGGLYVLAPITFGLSALIGFAMAYARRDSPDSQTRKRHQRQIWLFNLGFWTAVVGLGWTMTAVLTKPTAATNDTLSSNAQSLGTAGAIVMLLSVAAFWLKAVFDFVHDLSHPSEDGPR